LAADGRQIVARARSEASQYLSFYGEDIPIKELCDRVAHYVHLCTLYWWLRPFGSATILGGYDRDGPQLYMIEPSGVAYRYFGAAIGKGRQAAKTAIEKLKLSEMTCREGIIAVAKIIYEVHDEAKDKAFELELSWVCDESNKQHQRVCLLPLGYLMSFCSCFLTLLHFFWSCSFVVLDLMSRTNGWHLQVPAALLEEAKAAAKAAKDALDEDEGMDAD
jgi:hypothetical protein